MERTEKHGGTGASGTDCMGTVGRILERQHLRPVVTFSLYDVLTDFVVLDIASFL